MNYSKNMKHKDKVKMARKMMTREERKTKHGKTKDGRPKEKTPIFQSEAWEERKKIRMAKLS